jgi:hypothetical protein
MKLTLEFRLVSEFRTAHCMYCCKSNRPKARLEVDPIKPTDKQAGCLIGQVVTLFDSPLSQGCCGSPNLVELDALFKIVPDIERKKTHIYKSIMNQSYK